jgi:hypothetical protein
MSDFLTRLAQRQLGHLPVIEPRVPALYAPVVEEAAARMTINDTERRPLPRVEEEPVVRTKTSGKQEPSSEPDMRRGPSTEEPVVGPEPLIRKDPMEIDPEAARKQVVGPERPIRNDPMENAPEAPPEPGRITRNELPPKDIPHPVPLRPRAKGPSNDRPPAEAPPSVARGSSSVDEPPIVSPRKVALVSPGRSPDGMALERRRPSEHPIAPRSLVTPRQAAVYLRQDTPDAAEPPVHVTIGRIEVTAVSAAPAPKRTPPRSPSMSLDEYLARRQRRER